MFACLLTNVQLFNILVLFLEIIRWCPTIEHIISDGKLLIEQTKVHDSSMGPVSVLLEGKIVKEVTVCLHTKGSIPSGGPRVDNDFFLN